MEAEKEVASLALRVREFLEYTLLLERLSLRANLRRMQLLDYMEDVELAASFTNLLQQRAHASSCCSCADDEDALGATPENDCPCVRRSLANSKSVASTPLKETLALPANKPLHAVRILPNTDTIQSNLGKATRSTQRSTQGGSCVIPDILSDHAIASTILTDHYHNNRGDTGTNCSEPVTSQEFNSSTCQGLSVSCCNQKTLENYQRACEAVPADVLIPADDSFLSYVEERPVPHCQQIDQGGQDEKIINKDAVAELAERGLRFSRSSVILRRKDILQQWSRGSGRSFHTGQQQGCYKLSVVDEDAEAEGDHTRLETMGTSASTGRMKTIKQVSDPSPGPSPQKARSGDLAVPPCNGNSQKCDNPRVARRHSERNNPLPGRIGALRNAKIERHHSEKSPKKKSDVGSSCTASSKVVEIYQRRLSSLPPRNYVTNAKADDRQTGSSVTREGVRIAGTPLRIKLHISDVENEKTSQVQKGKALRCNALPRKKKDSLLNNAKQVRQLRRAIFSRSLCNRLAAMSMDSLMDSGYLSDIVTKSSIESPDKCGWLSDMTTSKKQWCILADMLLCVFDSDLEENPCRVIMMPGYHTRSMVFNTAKPDKLRENWHPGRTLSGVTRFQFVVEHPETSETFIFGTESQEELDDWIRRLQTASDLDANVFDDIDFEDNEYFQDILQSSSGSGDKNERMSTKKSDVPKQHILETQASSRSVTKSDKKSSVIYSPDTQKSHITNNHNIAVSICKVTSLPVNGHISYHPMPSNEEPSRARSTQRRRDHPRSRSIDSVIPDNEPNETGSTQKRQRSRERPRRAHSVERSNIGQIIARRANSFKELVFGTKTKVETVDDEQLQNEEILMSGYLQHKHLLKWSRLWCTASNSFFTAYKSKGNSGKPVFSLPLSECAVQSVERDRSRKLFVFKMSQFYAKSTYLAADELDDYTRWMSCLRKLTDAYDPSGMPPRPHSTDLTERISKKHLRSTLSGSSFPSGNVKISSKKGAFCPNSPIQGLKGSVSASWGEEYMKRLPRSHSSSSFGSSSAGSIGSTLSYDQDRKSADTNDNLDQVKSRGVKGQHHIPAHVIRQDASPIGSPKLNHQLRSLKSQLTVLPSKPVISSQTLPVLQVSPERETDVMIYLDAAAGTQTTPPHDELPTMTPQKAGRSLSDGSLQVPDSMMGINSSKRPKRPLVLDLAARDLVGVKAAHYLDRRDHNGQWTSCWCVLVADSLYIYDSSIDEVTLDVLPLKEYHFPAEVQPGDSHKTLVIALEHQEYRGEYFAADEQEVYSVWYKELSAVVGRKKSVMQNLNLEEPQIESISANSSVKDLDDSKWKGDLWRLRKQRLLQEVLKQKENIEKRQMVQKRLISSRNSSPEPENTVGNPTEAEMDIKARTFVRQKRMSLILKRDKLKHQLDACQSLSAKKASKLDKIRRGFTQKTSKVNSSLPPTPEQEQLMFQVEKYTEELQKLENEEHELSRPRRALEPFTSHEIFSSGVHESVFGDIATVLGAPSSKLHARRSESSAPVYTKIRRPSSESLAELVKKHRRSSPADMSGISYQTDVSRPSSAGSTEGGFSSVNDSNNNKRPLVANDSATKSKTPSCREQIQVRGDTNIANGHIRCDNRVARNGSTPGTSVKPSPENSPSPVISERALQNIAEFEEFLQEKLLLVQL